MRFVLKSVVALIIVGSLVALELTTSYHVFSIAAAVFVVSAIAAALNEVYGKYPLMAR